MGKKKVFLCNQYTTSLALFLTFWLSIFPVPLFLMSMNSTVWGGKCFLKKKKARLRWLHLFFIWGASLILKYFIYLTRHCSAQGIKPQGLLSYQGSAPLSMGLTLLLSLVLLSEWCWGLNPGPPVWKAYYALLTSHLLELFYVTRWGNSAQIGKYFAHAYSHSHWDSARSRPS